jgi:hypothetical protein
LGANERGNLSKPGVTADATESVAGAGDGSETGIEYGIVLKSRVNMIRKDNAASSE